MLEIKNDSCFQMWYRLRWQIGAMVLFALLIWALIFGYATNLKYSEVQKQQVAQLKTELNKFASSPIVRVSLDSVSVENGPPRPPRNGAIYVHVCGAIALHRSAIVNRDTSVFVGRNISTQTGLGDQNLTPGLEHMLLSKNPNPMTPKLIAASNWPRYTYFQYNTFLQAVPLTSGATPMQSITLYIIDDGQPLPMKHGDPIPQKPGPNDPPQPSCIIASASPASSPQ